MKLPTLPKPNLKLSVTTAAVAFLAGAALVLTPSSPKSQNIHLADATTTPTASQSDPSTTTTDPTSQSTDSTTSTGTTGSSTPSSSPSDSTSSPTTSPPSTSSTTTTTSSTQQSSPPAPVTAVSATLGGWVNQTSDNSYTSTTTGSGPTPGWYTEQYQYCTYTYSDNTTQQVLYQTREYWNDGHITNQAVVGSDCSVDNAPAGS